MPPTRRAAQPTPLAPLMALTAANSLGTGVVTNGVFFIAKHASAFGDVKNFALGVAMGVTYIIGALGVGPALRALAARAAWLSTRGVLVAICIALAALCMLPRAGAEWTIWVFVALYSPLTGCLWPIVESYLAGGRTDAELRRVVGVFNVVWAGAIVVAFLAMGPLLADHALLIVRALAGLHVLSAVALWWFHAEPGAHVETPHASDPEAARMLGVFRRLLPMAYLVLSAWAPYAPTAADAVGVSVAWSTAVAGVWQVARVGVFWAMGAWHGWHGWRRLPHAGAGLLLAGFVVAVAAPVLAGWIGPGAAPIAVLVAGLLCFGLGLAVIYTAALYYALEMGSAEVDAGAKHEALIGVGYTAGPACGLFASAVAASDATPTWAFQPMVFSLVGVACLVAMLGARRRGRRPRIGTPDPTPAYGPLAAPSTAAAVIGPAHQPENEADRMNP